MTDIANVREFLPHRPPFLFVDAILELEQHRACGVYRAAPEAFYFQGHFPGRPIMPGVLQCECCLQMGAILMTFRLGQYGDSGIPVATRILDAKFKRMVAPNDQLDLEVELDESVDNVFFMTGRVSCQTRLTTRTRFAVTLAPDMTGG